MKRRAPALDDRLAALAEAVGLATDRLDPAAVDAAAQVLDRAGARLGLGMATTVVALAGATGSGKSSLFNALAQAELSPPGVRRPTTGSAVAAIWPGPDDTVALLDWLAIPRRHTVEDGRYEGLVLLDLPDYDSVRTEHRAEVDRLVALVDLLVWVVDPQKYADAALHERYLRPLAGHAAVMVVVLNQVDRFAPRQAAEATRDLSVLLADEGLAALPVLAASARTGAGLPALVHLLDERVAARRAASARLTADVGLAAERLADAGARGAPRSVGVPRQEVAALVEAMSLAAGVPIVVDAVAAAHRRSGAAATGWPFTRWVLRLRPDPLRRLHLRSVGPAGAGARIALDPVGGPTSVPRSSLPPVAPAELARLRTATTDLGRAVAEGLPEPWPALIREQARASADELPDRLDRAVSLSVPSPRGTPRWWRGVGALQWLLAVAVLVGAGWLAVRAVAAGLGLGVVVPLGHVGQLPVPTLLLLGGALGGVLLAGLARLGVRAGARRRAGQVRRRLDAALADEAHRSVVAPVEAELAVHAALVAAVDRAHGELVPGGQAPRERAPGERAPSERRR